MKQIDMFEKLNPHDVSVYPDLEYDTLSDEYNSKMLRRIQAAFGNATEEEDPGAPVRCKVKARKKLVMIHEFVLVPNAKAQTKLSKNPGKVLDTFDYDPQYLVNLYKYTEDVALFTRDFHDFMEHFMNAVYLFTVATVYDGRLLVFVEDGKPIISDEETLAMIEEITNFINRSKVYRVHSQNIIRRTI